MLEWEGVYKELETLYFAAKEEAERKTETLQRSKRDLDVANESLKQLSDNQHR
jgi:flagellar biosynthesis chaperone FliJ